MSDAPDPESLLERARAGYRGSLARLLSLVERGGPDARAVGRRTHPLGGAAYTVGITGAPGAGKSTLTNALVRHIRAGAERVAVLAIDPSSPFTGGAILGDRVRMQDHTGDADVYIRSMATRGHLGGLSLATPEAIRALDATGWPWIVVETVGVGQVEVEVAGTADTRVVVVNPGWGDAVQANKAGLLEIADIFVINKADRPGVENTEKALKSMLDLAHPTERVFRHHGSTMRTAAPAQDSSSKLMRGGKSKRQPKEYSHERFVLLARSYLSSCLTSRCKKCIGRVFARPAATLR